MRCVKIHNVFLVMNSLLFGFQGTGGGRETAEARQKEKRTWHISGCTYQWCRWKLHVWLLNSQYHLYFSFFFFFWLWAKRYDCAGKTHFALLIMRIGWLRTKYADKTFSGYVLIMLILLSIFNWELEAMSTIANVSFVKTKVIKNRTVFLLIPHH